MSTWSHPGRVIWLGVRPARDAPMHRLNTVAVSINHGLAGDRYSGRNGKRQVTLIQAEHLTAVASYLNVDRIEPATLRRNIVVSGINLLALKNQTIRIGSTQLEVTGLCHPCSQMEHRVGPGGYNAMRGHGGITARVLADGEISVGDTLCVESAD